MLLLFSNTFKHVKVIRKSTVVIELLSKLTVFNFGIQLSIYFKAPSENKKWSNIISMKTKLKHVTYKLFLGKFVSRTVLLNVLAPRQTSLFKL